MQLPGVAETTTTPQIAVLAPQQQVRRRPRRQALSAVLFPQFCPRTNGRSTFTVVPCPRWLSSRTIPPD
jgi:hypothetical protein